MIRTFYLLSLNQFRIFFREPAAIFWAFAFPIMMAWVLGAAFDGERPEIHQVGLVEVEQGLFSQWLHKQPVETKKDYILYRPEDQKNLSFKFYLLDKIKPFCCSSKNIL